VVDGGVVVVDDSLGKVLDRHLVTEEVPGRRYVDPGDWGKQSAAAGHVNTSSRCTDPVVSGIDALRGRATGALCYNSTTGRRPGAGKAARESSSVQQRAANRSFVASEQSAK
jgi:hypothetical protein